MLIVHCWPAFWLAKTPSWIAPYCHTQRWWCSHFCPCGRKIFTMCDDKAVTVSKRQATFCNRGRFTCIVHYPQSRDTEILKYARIHTAVTVRQMQASECSRLDDIRASVPENFDACRHGHHRWCYTNFTNIAWLKSSSELPSTPLSALAKTVGTSQSATPCVRLFPQIECLFCNFR